jgi:hypothetical protein
MLYIKKQKVQLNIANKDELVNAKSAEPNDIGINL